MGTNRPVSFHHLDNFGQQRTAGWHCGIPRDRNYKQDESRPNLGGHKLPQYFYKRCGVKSLIRKAIVDARSIIQKPAYIIYQSKD